MSDDALPFLIRPRQKSWNIDKIDKWDIKSITETNKTSRFFTGVDIETTSKHLRLVGNDTDRATIEASETNHNVCGIVAMNF